MSETNPQAEGGPPPEPAAPATEAPAPAADGAAHETTDETKELEPKLERRLATLRARSTAGEQERRRLAQEVKHSRRRAPPQPAETQLTLEQQAAVDGLVEAKMAQRAEAER